MNEKKFLQQVYTKLENQLEQEVKLADDSIEISEGDKVIFRVDSKGDMLYSADKQFSNIVNKIYGKIENDVRNTKEFLKVMDSSPELTAVDLNAPYKKLLEYNDVVIAGTEHSDGSFEFVTWDCKNNSLDHGHYYEDYEIIIIYDSEYAEVIVFTSDRFMNSSNDIVSEAIRKGLMLAEHRDRVRFARGLMEFEYDYIKKGRNNI